MHWIWDLHVHFEELTFLPVSMTYIYNDPLLPLTCVCDAHYQKLMQHLSHCIHGRYADLSLTIGKQLKQKQSKCIFFCI